MFYLIISACALANPYQCHDVKLAFVEGNQSPGSCLFNGQLEIIKWKESHPNFTISKWKCTNKPEENL